MTPRKPPRTRNPIARDLRTPKYKPRVVKNKRAYSRKRTPKGTTQ
jgi:hypothetical protein